MSDRRLEGPVCAMWELQAHGDHAKMIPYENQFIIPKKVPLPSYFSPRVTRQYSIQSCTFLPSIRTVRELLRRKDVCPRRCHNRRRAGCRCDFHRSCCRTVTATAGSDSGPSTTISLRTREQEDKSVFPSPSPSFQTLFLLSCRSTDTSLPVNAQPSQVHFPILPTRILCNC